MTCTKTSVMRLQAKDEQESRAKQQLSDTFSSRQVFVSVFLTVGGYGYYRIFGSGTKLYVTDEPVVKPVVSVYPAASRAHLEGKSSLLCLASAMSPPLVQFSWKRQKEDGSLEELTRDDGEQLVLTEPGRTAAILLIHQPENSTYKYRCYVKHEGGTVEAQTQQGDEGSLTVEQ
ncbi:immunoglobulin lambda-1 light chain-like [Seriola dumerili]|uniref:immunoglobulin lambda-1 light chain-like n=1 Tax=Seriola dumerili TaxID=41447 RepID=UPI000BBED591|nr:immunoglobulin lambda-1 light chain-like [Seriola dumerili]